MRDETERCSLWLSSLIPPPSSFSILERETRFELATLALARRCSTTELLPLWSTRDSKDLGIVVKRRAWPALMHAEDFRPLMQTTASARCEGLPLNRLAAGCTPIILITALARRYAQRLCRRIGAARLASPSLTLNYLRRRLRYLLEPLGALAGVAFVKRVCMRCRQLLCEASIASISAIASFSVSPPIWRIFR